MEKMLRTCELCNGEASLYCPSDNAFLCYTCDSKVHCANFLVARHVRSFICHFCCKLQGDQRFSGACVPPFLTHVSCVNCTPTAVQGGGGGGGGDDDCLSSSSSCVSSTGEGVDEVESTKRIRNNKVNMSNRIITVVADMKVEGVLVNWCRRMGVEDGNIGVVVNMVVDLLTTCFDKIPSLPFKVSLVVSFWVAIRMVCHRKSRCSSTCQDLKKVEQISGVPAKLILAIEVKLARVIKHKKSREDHKEGWAEC